MTVVEPKPYGSWPSPITIDSLVQEIVGLGALHTNGTHLFWLERRPDEDGRETIVQCIRGEDEFNYDPRQYQNLLAKPYSVTSRVHEYGGGSYCVGDSHVYFVNARDQNLYAITLEDRSVRQITQGDQTTRFADLVLDQAGQHLYCIRETHTKDKEPKNDIVSVQVANGEVSVLVEGNDFYAAPRLSPDGQKLAYITWDHPNMPFNGTQLILLDLTTEVGSKATNNAASTFVAGGSTESVVQPTWISNDSLLFASDRSGFWNLYIYDSTGVFCIAEDEAEYATAPWQFGSRNFIPIDERFILSTRRDLDGQQLVIVDSELGVFSPICKEFCSYGSITYLNGKIYFLAGRVDDHNAIIELDTQADLTREVQRQTSAKPPREYVSYPQRIRYKNTEDNDVHAYFYEPCCLGWVGPSNERPPLLVMSHGGPTASTGPDLSLKIQFYTTRGWAVLDVDYGGSTGYGRAYRDRLTNNWGVTDVTDCEAGVRYLISQDLVDPRRVAIIGSSAGGYTTLRALTTSSLFSVGASHYGISDVRLLVKDTHKFESRYIDQLIPETEWSERSPIEHIDNFRCPVIFFQGADDFVVPKSQAKDMYDALSKRGLFTALFVYAGEGHGFRKAVNIQTTFAAQYKFFGLVLGFETPDIEISSLKNAEVANAPWL